MLEDAEFVCASESRARTRWLFGGFLGAGIAHLLLGRHDEAVRTFREALTLTSGHSELPRQGRVPRLLGVRPRGDGQRTAARRAAGAAMALSAAERLDGSLLGDIATTAWALVLAPRR